MPRYANMIYNGYWWSPERRMLQTAIDRSQQVVNGRFGSSSTRATSCRRSPVCRPSLFDERHRDLRGGCRRLQPEGRRGFIKLNALRIRIAANKGVRHYGFFSSLWT